MSLFNAMLGALGNQGTLGQLAQMATQNPAVMQAAAGLLGGQGVGGINGLLTRFQEAGLGDVAQSWVATGENRAIEPAQIEGALGADLIGQFAAKAGIGSGEASSLLAQVLPMVVDSLTPNGRATDMGSDSADALANLLGGLLKGRG